MRHQTADAPSGRPWGIRSLATASVYPWAATKEAAEFMWAGTGAPDRYEVVRCCGDEWVTEPSVSLPPIPAFAKEPIRERFGDDDEVVRMAICLADPLYGKKVEPLKVSAAEIRQLAEQRKSDRIGQRLRRLAWWRSTS